MYLKSLDMFGFKSFADKTHLEFSQGITCLIGPNGSGKSNILDAIQWVLGEQTSSTLRAKEMKDVIFSGTQKRKPLDFAEVALVLSNDERVLKIDTSEVEIKRRLYMDGRSEYYINRQLCRLKDIRTLFFDTGVGKSVYSVIQQGKIKDILSTKPEDRRLIFEEAAGISGSKQEEKESISKLQSMDENIKTVMVEYETIKHSHDKLKLQASRVEEYKKLSEKLRALETRYAVISFLSLESERVKCENNIKKCDEELEKIKSKQSTLQGKKDEITSAINTLSEQSHQMQMQAAGKSESISGLNYTIFSIENQIKSLDESAQTHAQRLKNIEQEVEANKIEKEKISFELLKLEEKKKELEQNIGAINSQLSENKSKLAEENKNKKGYEDEKENEQNALSDLYKNFAKNSSRIIKSLSAFISPENKTGELEDEIYATIDLLYSAMDKKTLDKLKNLIDEYISKVKASVMSIKEEDIKIAQESDQRIDDAQRRINVAVKQIRSSDAKITELLKEKDEKERAKSAFEQEKSTLMLNQNTLLTRLEMINKNQSGISERYKIIKSDIENLNSQNEALNKQRNEKKSQLENTQKEIDSLKIKITKVMDEIEKHRKSMDAIITEVSSERILAIQESRIKYEGRKEIIENNTTELANKFYEQWGESLKNKSEEISKSADKSDEKKDEIKKKISEIKENIKSLGQMNHLAAEEYKEVKARYDLIQSQLDDLNKAREDLKAVSDEIHERSAKQFVEIFEKVNQEFHNFFVKLFSGGDAYLSLAGDDPLSCGINIIAKPAGKEPKDIIALSGGEQTMTVFSLLFAIYKVKASPFCILDEVESALDEKNVRKFLSLIKEFENITQFIIITHNSHTVLGANTLLGTTQEEQGVTKVLSINVDRTGDKTVYRDAKTGKVANIKLDNN